MLARRAERTGIPLDRALVSLLAGRAEPRILTANSPPNPAGVRRMAGSWWWSAGCDQSRGDSRLTPPAGSQIGPSATAKPAKKGRLRAARTENWQIEYAGRRSRPLLQLVRDLG